MGGYTFPGTTPIDVNSPIGAIGVPALGQLSTSTAAPSIQAATAAAVASPAPAQNGGLFGNMFAPKTPQINPVTGENMNPSFFQSGGALDVGLGALQTLGNLWNSFQQMKLAKDQFSFQKEAYNTNLANQEMAYNTTLENRARTAGTFNGTDKATTDQYIKDHSL